MDERQRMSRALRTGRGAFGAFASTSLAAASHALAGGTITWLAVIATAILALPLCVLLAGRIGSLWRLAIAVGTSQFIYHWSFSGLGIETAPASSTAALPAHAEHLASLGTFAPALAGAGAADAWMWLGHGIAAALTILLLHRGERALIALGRLVRRLVFSAPRIPVPRSAPAIAAAATLPVSDGLFSVSAITHRGPPAA